MPEFTADGDKLDELKKMTNIATDLGLSEKMRTQAINGLGEMGSHEALVALLNLAANERLHIPERELALKKAKDIVKKGI
jgi:hypothetical protein